MSSLTYYTDSTQIFVATDTLAVEPSGNPMMFCSKAIYLPHLRTIIAGTGMGMFSGDWAMDVKNRMILAGIRNLDCHTPAALRDRWSQYTAQHSLSAAMTTTVYHFGISEDDKAMCAYAYRSTNGFVSEPIGHGFGLKPECTLFTEGSLVEALPAMMREQRERQAAKPTDERLYIGGECIGLHLTAAGCQTYTVFQFEDYPEQLQAVFEHHRRGGA